MASRKTKPMASASSDMSEESEAEDDVLILNNNDPFDGPGGATNSNAQKSQVAGHNFVHLHFQKRNARQCLTSVRGLPDDLDMRKLTRHFKKAWCCNGTTTKHAEWGDIIQLQGDHRRDIFKFLIDEGISTKEEIKIHGY